MRRFPIYLLTIIPTFAATEKIDFTTQIQPILSENCYACHGPDESKVEGGLRLDVQEKALKGGDSGKAIVPGNANASSIMERIMHTDPKEVMPPPEKKKRLSPEKVQLIRDWINQGAKWGTHWAFQAPKRPPVPQVKNKAWVKNAIDAFVMARLEKEKLSPAPMTQPATLLRRLSLDLIGLPPTLEELAVAGDPNKEIERLISNPHFGERWGREWLDAARYSDSAGYEKDLPRYHHFYRDWVVSAINENMPYNEFV